MIELMYLVGADDVGSPCVTGGWTGGGIRGGGCRKWIK